MRVTSNVEIGLMQEDDVINDPHIIIFGKIKVRVMTCSSLPFKKVYGNLSEHAQNGCSRFLYFNPTKSNKVQMHPLFFKIHRKAVLTNDGR